MDYKKNLTQKMKARCLTTIGQQWDLPLVLRMQRESKQSLSNNTLQIKGQEVSNLTKNRVQSLN